MKIKAAGYTLIEVIIALTVFAIIAVLAVSAMYQVFDMRTRLNLQAEQLNNLQLGITLITRDSEQIIARAIIGENMKLMPIFSGDTHYLEFSRGGLFNPMAIKSHSSLARIAYLCINNTLVRRSWASLDDPYRTKFRDKTIFTNLEACEFAYMNHERKFLANWEGSNLKHNSESLPIALQFKLKIAYWGKISLLFIIPVALYAN